MEIFLATDFGESGLRESRWRLSEKVMLRAFALHGK